MEVLSVLVKFYADNCLFCWTSGWVSFCPGQPAVSSGMEQPYSPVLNSTPLSVCPAVRVPVLVPLIS